MRKTFKNGLVLLFLMLAMGRTTFAQDSASTLLAEAERHYQQRNISGEPQKAIELYREALAKDPAHYEVAWKLSKALWYVGNFLEAEKKAQWFEQGMQAAEKAVALNPGDCEGHFWLGVNQALYAENSNMFKALGMVDKVKEQMKAAMEIDERCECAGPERVLGKLYARVPWFKGGSKSKSISYLKRSLELCPNDTQSRIFLAETYVEQGKSELASQQLQLVLDQQPDPEWIPETKQNKIIAEKMLTSLKKK